MSNKYLSQVKAAGFLGAVKHGWQDATPSQRLTIGIGGVNPEVTKLKASPINALVAGMSQDQYAKHLDELLQKHTYVHTNPEGFSNKYLKGSKNYVGNSGKEILDYISHNKSRFTKGVGKAALGLGAVGGGAYLFNQGRPKVSDAKTN